MRGETDVTLRTRLLTLSLIMSASLEDEKVKFTLKCKDNFLRLSGKWLTRCFYLCSRLMTTCYNYLSAKINKVFCEECNMYFKLSKIGDAFRSKKIDNKFFG